MKAIVTCLMIAGVALTGVTSAQAADGCGRGGHRGPHGRCRPNDRPLVVGSYYHGQGYWDDQRYWHNRYRDHGNWRYR